MTRHTDPRQIEASLAAQRSALHATLDALHDRIAPEKLAQDVWGKVRRQMGWLADTTDRAVRGNPVGFAITAVGLGWMLFGGKRQPHLPRPPAQDMARWEDEGGSPLPDHFDEAATVAATDTRLAQTVAAKTVQQVDDTPLIFGAIAVLVGAACGAALTRTKIEDQLLGAESDRFHAEAATLLRTEKQRLRGLAGELTQIITDGLRDSLTAATGTLSDTISKVGTQVRTDLEKP